MTVRVYRWDDASAPTLNASAGSLVALLKAVLVDGYAGKTAAGWTNPAYSTNKAAFQNAGSGQCLVVDHPSTTINPTVYGVESITSGFIETNRFPTTLQMATAYWSISNTADTTNRPWIILADNKRFYLWVGYNLTTAQALSASTTAQMLWFAGDILSYKGGDAFPFMICSQLSTGANSNPFGSCQTSLGSILATGHYMARTHLQSGASVGVGKVSDYGLVSTTSSGNATSYAYPDSVSGGMSLSKIRVFESSIYGPRGLMPGMWFVNHSMPGNNGDTFTGSSGGQLAGKTFILLDASSSGGRVRFALETSDTWGY